MSDNTKRIISGAVLILIIAAAGLFGGPVLLLFCGALSILGMREFYRAVSVSDRRLTLFSYVLAGIYYGMLLLIGKTAQSCFVFSAFILYMVFLVLTYPEFGIRDISLAFAGFIYVAYLMSFLYLCRESSSGFALYAFVFVCSWLGDTCAYSIGRRFGKHKMVPLLSPKKSWEGFAAGVIGCGLIGLLYGILFQQSFRAVSHPVLSCFVAAVFGQLLSVAGDLAASGVKREFGIKDYSALIPGHGGVLDRFDSVLFAAPFVYLVFSIMENIVL